MKPKFLPSSMLATAYYSALTAITLFSAGCGEANPMNRQSISGHVSLQGTPLKSGSIEFHPTEKGGIVSGATISDGQYEVSSERGVPPGSYVVRVYASNEDEIVEDFPGESTGKVAKELIPPQFNTKSDLQLIVSADQSNVFDVTIPTSTN